MTRKILKITLLTAAILVVVAYLSRLGEEFPVESADTQTMNHRSVALFGGTGTAGDGLLKALLNNPTVETIHVITRRSTPRIDAGVNTGKVEVILHRDYLDYTPLEGLLSEVDAVFWALGTSASNVSKEEYSVIHIDYPVRFVETWLASKPSPNATFHYISGQGADEGSRMHWAREKARAERELSESVRDTQIQVISYRPGWIVPASEQASFLQNVFKNILVPVKLAVSSTMIGEAMLEVSARGEQLENGSVINNREILQYANAYAARSQIVNAGETR